MAEKVRGILERLLSSIGRNRPSQQWSERTKLAQAVMGEAMLTKEVFARYLLGCDTVAVSGGSGWFKVELGRHQDFDNLQEKDVSWWFRALILESSAARNNG
ncbi:hypothetical protein VNO77_03219 [Canavalia gladiata]|uniref:Uncharacterized protein n=1 Tax=Canavalia gladiata TaxID=3824 RepID=A0AAN9RC08_CANGL